MSPAYVYPWYRGLEEVSKGELYFLKEYLSQPDLCVCVRTHVRMCLCVCISLCLSLTNIIRALAGPGSMTLLFSFFSSWLLDQNFGRQ